METLDILSAANYVNASRFLFAGRDFPEKFVKQISIDWVAKKIYLQVYEVKNLEGVEIHNWVEKLKIGEYLTDVYTLSTLNIFGESLYVKTFRGLKLIGLRNKFAYGDLYNDSNISYLEIDLTWEDNGEYSWFAKIENKEFPILLDERPTTEVQEIVLPTANGNVLMLGKSELKPLKFYTSQENAKSCFVSYNKTTLTLILKHGNKIVEEWNLLGSTFYRTPKSVLPEVNVRFDKMEFTSKFKN